VRHKIERKKINYLQGITYGTEVGYRLKNISSGINNTMKNKQTFLFYKLYRSCQSHCQVTSNWSVLSLIVVLFFILLYPKRELLYEYYNYHLLRNRRAITWVCNLQYFVGGYLRQSHVSYAHSNGFSIRLQYFNLVEKTIMFTVGGVGRHYRSIYWPTLDRYVNRVSTATRPTYLPRLDRVSVEHRSTVVEHQPRYRRMCVSTDTVLVSSTLGRYLIDTLPIVCRYFTNTRSILGRPSFQRREGKGNLDLFFLTFE